MSVQAWITLGIVIGSIALFASERVRVDIVALIALALLAIFGIVTPAEALAGFSNEATVTVAAMFALSLGIERSGALEPLAALLSRIRRPWLLTLALMLTIAPIGAFVKNIALVATFLPLALRVCLPALNNNLVNLLKTTTLAYAIAVPETLYASAQIWAQSQNVTEMMCVLLAVFVLLVGALVWIMHRWERALRIPGFGR